LFELLLRGGTGGNQALLPVEFVLLIVDHSLGCPGISPFLVVGRLHRVNLVPHGRQLRLGFLDRNLERSLIDAKKHLAGGNPIVVVNIDLDNAAGYVRADRDPCRLDIGVIGGDITSTRQVPIAAGKQDDEWSGEHQREAYPLAQGALAPDQPRAAAQGGAARADRRSGFVFGGSRHL
jgi:hypothetical protein